jgi:hypothetical protein
MNLLPMAKATERPVEQVALLVAVDVHVPVEGEEQRHDVDGQLVVVHAARVRHRHLPTSTVPQP